MGRPRSAARVVDGHHPGRGTHRRPAQRMLVAAPSGGQGAAVPASGAAVRAARGAYAGHGRRNHLCHLDAIDRLRFWPKEGPLRIRQVSRQINGAGALPVHWQYLA